MKKSAYDLVNVATLMSALYVFYSNTWKNEGPTWDQSMVKDQTENPKYFRGKV